MEEYILNLSWWCDLLTFQEEMRETLLKYEQCDENTACAPQRKYGQRMQCYKPVLPIVTMFTQTQDEKKFAQAGGGNPFPQCNL